MAFLPWLRGVIVSRHPSPHARRLSGRKRRFRNLEVELLEDRTLPSTLIVNNPTDMVVAGEMSLRQAVATANTDAAAGTSDTINFDSSLAGATILLTQGQLELSGAGTGIITIDGSSLSSPLTVSGNHAGGVFQIDGGVQAVLTGIHIEQGAGQLFGGGISSSGTLTLNDVTLSGNSATYGGGLSVFGGTVSLNGDSFSGNSAGEYGGAVFNSGTVNASNCTFTSNSTTGGSGGAIADFLGGSSCTLTGCTFTGNSAGAGGAIDLDNSSSASLFTDCTFTDNSATGAGGAIENYQSPLTVSGSTFSGNSAATGGALDNKSGSTTISNSSFAGDTGIGINDASGTVIIQGQGWTSSDSITAAGHSTLDLYGSWTNNGTISVAATSTLGLGSTVAVDPTSSAAAAYVWTNKGMITIADGATIYLGGILTTDEYDSNLQSLGVSVDLAKDTVYLAGTLDNSVADNPISAGILTLNAFTGPLTLYGGEIYQGTITSSGSDDLVANNSYNSTTDTYIGGTLDAVTLDGTLDMHQQNATVTIVGGLTLDTQLNVSGYAAVLDFNDSNPQTIGGTAIILLGGEQANLDNLGTQVLTFGPNLTIQGGSHGTVSGNGPIDFQGTINDTASGGTLTINTPSWANEGTITATGATLDLYGNWTNNGTIAVDAASTVALGNIIAVNPTSSAARYTWTNKGTIAIANGATVYLGDFLTTDEYDGNLQSLGVSANLAKDTVYLAGTLDNSVADNSISAGILTLSASTGPLTLSGGEIYQGTITTSGSDDLVASNYYDSTTNTYIGGTLDGVTLNGTLDMSQFSDATVIIVGGLTLDTELDLSGEYDTLNFNDSNPQTVAGTATIGLSGYGAALNNLSSQPVTLDSTITISVTSQSFYGGVADSITGPIDNQGTMQVKGAQLTIQGAWVNSGTISASNGATLDLYGKWANSGAITSDGSSTIGLGSANDVNPTTSAAAAYVWTNTGAITIADGATVYLGGILTTDEYDSSLQSLGVSANLGNDTVHLVGTMDNSAADNPVSKGLLALNASTGPLTLSGGEIYQGTITTSGNDDVAVSGYSSVSGAIRAANGTVRGNNQASSGHTSTLDAVTLNGTLDLSAYEATVAILGGLTLDTDLNVSGQYASLNFNDSNSQTMGGGGTITLSGHSAGLDNLSNQSVTINTPIIIAGTPSSSNALIYGSFTFFNTIQVTGTRLTIEGAWGNFSTITATSGATLGLYGNWTNFGTITVDDSSTVGLGSTIAVNSTSSDANTYTWSNYGTLTIANGATVYLGGVFTTDEYVSNFQSLGVSVDLTKDTIFLSGTMDNSAADNPVSGGVLTLGASSGPFTLTGGEIYQGTITTSGSDDLVAGEPFNSDDDIYDSEGSTLDGVTLNGTLDMTENYYVTVTILDGLTLNGTIELGGASGTSNYASLYFGNGNDNTAQTISGTGTIEFGQGSGTNYLRNYSNDTLTIGPNITLQGGPYSDVSGTGPIDFQGTINDTTSGGTLTIDAPGWTNEGTITATGATLDLYGSWTNFGSISVDSASTVSLGSPIAVNPTSSAAAAYTWAPEGGEAIAGGATVYLGGVFTTDDFGILGIGGPIYLTGTMDNSAADNHGSNGVLALNGTSTLLLDGGEIYHGIITTSAGNELVATTSGAILGGVTLNGALDLTENNDVAVTIEDGLTLNGTIELGRAAGTTNNYAYLYFGSYGDNTAQTISGTGTIQFGQGSSYYSELIPNVLQNNSNDTLTIGPNITVAAGLASQISSNNGGPIDNKGTIKDNTSGGQLTINVPGWINQGTITVTHATLDLDRTWTNQGTISVDAASTIGLGSTIAVNPTSSAAAGYAWTNSGTIAIANGATVDLGGVFTADAFLDNSAGLSFSITQDKVYLTGTLDNRAADNPVSAGTLPLSAATGPLNLAGGEIYQGIITTSGGDDLVASPFTGATLDGVTLDGTLDMTQGNDVAVTVADGLVLNGIIELGGASGTGNYGYLYFGTNNDNTAQTISGTGTIQFGQGSSTSDLENNSNATLTIGPNLTIQGGLHGDISGNGPINFQGTVNDAAGGGALSIEKSFINSGTVVVGSGATLSTDGENYTQSSGTTTVDGTFQVGTSTLNLNGGLLDGSGTVNGNVVNAGTLTPGDGGSGTLTVKGNYTQTAAGALDIDLGGSSQNNALAVTATAALGGALNVALIDNFTPTANQQFVVLTFKQVSGDFAATNGINPAADGVFLAPTFTTSNLTLAAALPNLVVTAAPPSSPVVEGTTLPLSWTVTNQSTTIPATLSWTDRVYLSTVSVLDSTAIPLISVAAPPQSPLAPTTSYTSNVSVTMPDNLPTGSYYLLFLADVNGTQAVTDTASLFVAVPINMTAVELNFTAVSAPAAVNRGDTVAVSWTVQNSGNAATGTTWTDAVYLSSSSTLDSSARLLNSFTAPPTSPLAAGASYTLNENVTIPKGDSTAAPQYLLFVINSNAVQPESNTTNDVSAHLVQVDAPQLMVQSFTPPSAGVFGQSANISWTVANTGALALNQAWNDLIYFSSKSTLDGSATLFDTVPASDVIPLAASASYTRNVSATLPLAGSANGTYYLFLVADGTDQLGIADRSQTVASQSIVMTKSALTLMLASQSVSDGAGADATTATVTRNTDTSNPLVVTLSNSNSAEVSVPQTVTIPAGQTSVTFPVGTINGGLVVGTQTATLTASATGVDSGSVVLTVTDVNTPTLGITLSASQVTEGDSVTATITRNAGLNSPLNVVLAESDPIGTLTAFDLPAVTIPAGQQSVTVTLPTIQNSVIEKPKAVTIADSATGFSAASAIITVITDDIPNLSLSVTPASFSKEAGSDAALGTVTRDLVSDQPLTIKLLSGNTNKATVPATVVIPANQASATFPISAVDDTTADGNVTVTISANGAYPECGCTILQGGATTNIVVTDNTAPGLSLSLSSASTTKGATIEGTIIRTGDLSAALTVALSASDATKVTVPATVTIPAGVASAGFAITAVDDGVAGTQANYTITASADGYGTSTSKLEVLDTHFPDLVVASVTTPETVSAGSNFNVTYRIQNNGLLDATGDWQQVLYLSPDSTLDANAVAEDTFDFNGTLPAGLYLDHTITISSPAQLGTYYAIVVTNANDTITESDLTNDTTASPPITVSAGYSATVSTSVTTALAGTVIPLTGHATNTADGSPAAFAAVDIHIDVRDTDRVVTAVADAHGNFATSFTPLPGEAGDYTIGATYAGAPSAPVQGTFTLLGISANPASASAQLIAQGSAVSGTVTLTNFSETPLTDVSARVLSKPVNVNVSLTLGDGTAGQSIAGDQTLSLSYTLTAIASSLATGTVTLQVITTEGATVDIPIDVTTIALAPQLAANPAQLQAGMLSGQQTLVQFEVENTGGAETGPLTLSLPSVPWLAAGTPTSMASIPAQGSAAVVLQLTPPSSLALGNYTGQVVVLGNNGLSLTVPFTFKMLSEATGGLTVVSQDEYTYFAAGNPPVVGASVSVTDQTNGSVAATGTTGADGTVTFPSLREGYYTVNVTDAGHNSYSSVVLVSAGETATVTAFLPRNLVTYNWTVTPTQVADETQITLQTTFETNVPAPVVTIDPGYIDASTLDFTKGYAQINYTITNHGLIAAQNVVLHLPQLPDMVFKALVTNIGTLAGQSSVTIPVILQPLVPVSLGTPDVLADFTDDSSLTPQDAPADGSSVTPQALAADALSPQDQSLPPPVTLAECGINGPQYGGNIESDQILEGELEIAKFFVPVVQATFGKEAASVYTEFLSGGPDNPYNPTTSPNPVRNFGNDDEVVTRPPGFGYGAGFKVAPETIETMKQVLSFASDVINNMLSTGYLNSCSLPGSLSLDAIVSYADKHGMNGTQRFQQIECNYNQTSPDCTGGLLTGGVGDSDNLGTLDSRQITGSIQLTPYISSLETRLKLTATLHFSVIDSFDFNPYGLGSWAQTPLYLTAGFGLLTFTQYLADLEKSGWAQAVPIDVEFDDTSGPTFIPICQYVIRDGCAPVCPQMEANVSYDYVCGNPIQRFVAGLIQGNRCCKPQLPDSGGPEPSLGYGPNATTGGVGGPCSSPSAVPLSTDLATPDGTLSADAASVCAKVVLQLDQSAVQTREAFTATLQLVDNELTDVTDVKIDLIVQDTSGTYDNALFGVGSPDLSGLSAVDGTGDVAAGTTGTATWTLIPSLAASGSSPTQYTVGGTLQYMDEGVPVSITLANVPITVYPQPELHLDYFLQRDVIGDDPLTPQIEPSQPFELDVLVNNVGAGAAQNLSIAAAQPKIVDNAKGLLINFTTLGTEVNGQSLTPSLTADFGTVAPGTTALARWFMESSLQGLFTDYSATFEHQGIGGQELSLIDSVKFHVLIHTGEDFGGGDSPGLAFLVNDTGDGTDTPNEIYFTDDSTAPVTVSPAPTFDGAPSGDQLSIHMTVPAAAGWQYIDAPDPGNGNYELVSVIRSDGTILPTQDFWQTTRTFIGNSQPPLDEDDVHILDHDGTGSYTLVYAPADKVPPTIVQVSQPSPDPATTPVDGLTVTFSKPIDPTTFGASALTLTRGGGANLITANSGITIAQVSPTVYQINGLTALDAGDGVYALGIDASGIADPVGILGTGSGTATWTMAAISPAVASLSGVTSGERNTAVGPVDVVFTKAIDPSTFVPGALSLTLNGGNNLITGSDVTISQVSGNTYQINGLDALTAADGNYSLTIDDSQVQDLSGDLGVGPYTVAWTMDTKTLAISQVSTVAPSPRNFSVSTVEVTFNKAIDPTTFTPSSLSLTQGNGPNLISGSNVTISNVSGATYEIDGLDTLTAADGSYKLTVNATTVKDPAGNAGLGSGSVSFVVDTQAPAAPSDLAVAPASGIPATDGMVNSESVTLTGTLAEPGLTVHAVDATTGADLGDALVSGTTFSLPIQFTGPGEQQLVVNAIDAAGNVSPDATLNAFVDLTPLSVTGISTIASPRNTSVASVFLTFNKAIDASTLTPSDFSLTLEGGPNLIAGSNVTISNVSGNTYQISGLDALDTADGSYTLTLLGGQVADPAGKLSESATVSWLIDTLAPTSQVSALPKQETSLNFPVTATGTDPIPSDGGTPSGIQSYDLYVSDNGGSFTFWTTVPATDPTATYAGQSGHTYAFYSIASDGAGNVESKTPLVEASTFVPDLVPPSTQVTSVDASNPSLVVSWSGIDFGGSGLASFTLYVQVDSNAVTEVGVFGAGPPNAAGISTGSTTYQAITDGAAHTYRFYTIGTDHAGNVESPPSSPTAEVLIAAAFPEVTTLLGNLSSPTISYGTANTVVSGQLETNPAMQALPAGEMVQVTLDGQTQNATFDSSGHFSTTFFTTATLGVSASPYSITFSYAGDADFSGATATSSLTVTKASQAILFSVNSPVISGVSPITLSATGGGSGNRVTFSIVSGPGSILNGNILTISGVGAIVIEADQAASANYAAAPPVQQTLVVEPIYQSTLSENENTTTPTAVTIASLLSGHTNSAKNGIAVSETTGTGSWQFSTNGKTWANIGAVSDSQALLLPVADRLRFLPGPGYIGQADLLFQAWDGVGGTAGGRASVAVSGGGAPFSAGTAELSVQVNSTGTAPTWTASTSTLTPVMPGTTNPAGDSVESVLDAVFSDGSTTTAGIAVVGLTGTTSGKWEYSLNGGQKWNPFGKVAAATALLLEDTDLIRFVPNRGFAGVVAFEADAWDGTGTDAGTANLSGKTATGGNTHFGDTLLAGRLAVNTAPTLGTPGPSLPSIVENTAGAAVAVTKLLSSEKDVDKGALKGVALVATSGTGAWQFSLNAGKSWQAVGTVSSSSALLLASTALVRFVPAVNQTGPATLGYRAWDQTTGTSGSLFAVGSTGGASAFSPTGLTATLAVTPGKTGPAWFGSGAALTPVLPYPNQSNGDSVESVFGPYFAGTATGIAVTFLNGTADGIWDYSTDGITWNAIGTVTSAKPKVLVGSDKIRFVPTKKGFAGTVMIMAKASDGGTGFSSATLTATCLVNTAPTLTA